MAGEKEIGLSLHFYPGTPQLEPTTEVKGNIWIVRLDLNNRKEMSKHIPTHKRNHMAAILPGPGSKPAQTVWKIRSILQFISTAGWNSYDPPCKVIDQ